MNATVYHADTLFSKLIPDAAARHNGVQQGGRRGARRGVNIRCILATRSICNEAVWAMCEAAQSGVIGSHVCWWTVQADLWASSSASEPMNNAEGLSSGGVSCNQPRGSACNRSASMHAVLAAFPPIDQVLSRAATSPSSCPPAVTWQKTGTWRGTWMGARV